jgi:hypothetical protein
MTAAEAENEMLHGTIESLQALNAQMQFDMQQQEQGNAAELQLMSTQIVRLEGELRLSKGES